MAYTALYRTWRPVTFDDVVGQSHITETLKNEIMQNRVGHAYLFCGSRGTGKTSTARILSRAMNCLAPKNGNPCNVCENCRGILNGSILDITEIDAASNNGVDSIRDLREEARFEGAALKNKIYIIDEVHMLSQSAFNALLKILEEPPKHVHFILATTEAHKVPQTILSRCQRFDFRRIRTADIEKQLLKILKADDFSAEERGVRLMAEKADGSMRDALSILDQCMAIGGKTLTYTEIADFIGTTSTEILYEIAEGIATKDKTKMLSALRTYADEGKQVARLCEDFVQYIRNLLLTKYTEDVVGALDVTADYAEELKELSGKFSEEQLVYILKTAMDTAAQMRFLSNPRVSFELALIKMANPVYAESPEGLAARLSELEAKVLSGAFCVPVPQKTPEKKEGKKEAAKEEKKEVITPKAASQGENIGTLFLKKKDAVIAKLLADNHLQIMMATESVAAAREESGKLCLLFEDEDALRAAKVLLMDDNMLILKDAVKEVVGSAVNIILDKVSNGHQKADDPLLGLTNF